MKRFTQLFLTLDATLPPNEKVAALKAYFQAETPSNAVWALYLLLGKTRRRLITTHQLREIFLCVNNLPDWLFDACYDQVRDSAEVIALLLPTLPLPQEDPLDLPLHCWMADRIPQVKLLQSKRAISRLIVSWWAGLDTASIVVLNKLLTGTFRPRIPEKLIIRGLAAAHGISETVLTHRLMGDFTPTAAFYTQLVRVDKHWDDHPSQDE